MRQQCHSVSIRCFSHFPCVLIPFFCFVFVPPIGASLFPNWPSSSETPAEFGLQQPLTQEDNSPAWSVSYTAPNDRQKKHFGPSDHYVFRGVPFAKPPDPQRIWQQQLHQPSQNEAQHLELLGKTEIPQAIRNYFSLDLPPDKVIKELTGVDLHSLLGPNFEKLIDTTAAPTFTRPTTPKDKLVQYFERSLDNFLDGRYRAMERIPYLVEKEKQMQQQKEEKESRQKQQDEQSEEGSGEGPDELAENYSSSSSISGIPKQIPFIPKVPVEFVVPQEDQPTEIVSKLFELNAKKVEKDIDHVAKTMKQIGSRPKAKGVVLVEKSMTPEGEGKVAKPIMQDFQYGDKPRYQQGVVSSLLQFLGFNSPQTSTELDQVLTEWIMDHSPKHITKEKKSYGEESSYARIQKLLSSPVTPLCSVGTEPMRNFELDALMGQWFEVMHSPLMATSMCTMFFYEMLSRSSNSEGVGSVFQTLQFSNSNGNRSTTVNPIGEFRRWGALETMPLSTQQQPVLSSGYAIVSRPGQIVFRRSNTPEEVTVRVIDASYGDNLPSSTAFGGGRRGRPYEYVILGINCNYPLYVIAREPYTFKQKYARRVMDTLESKGLINDFSRLLNIVTGIDPSQCQLPLHLFDAKQSF